MDNLSLQEAKLVIPHNVQAQILGAIECIMKGDDKEQKIYLSRLARIVKTVASNYYLEEGYDSNYDRINRSPYGRCSHQDRLAANNVSGPYQEGMLGGELSGCSARNVDFNNRGVFCELEYGTVGVLNICAHYEQNSFNEKKCASVRDDLQELLQKDSSYFKELTESSKIVLDYLYSVAEEDNSRPSKFNKVGDKSKFFPVDLYSLLDVSNREKDSVIANNNKLKTEDSKKRGDAKADIKKSKEALDEILDKELYRTLNNLLNLSQYVAKNYPEEDIPNQLVTSSTNILNGYSKLLAFYSKNKDCFNNPDTVVTRALDSCVKALQDSAFVVTENQLICSFRNCFDRNLRLDIQNLRNKNELTLDDLDFINTKKYISQFHQLNNSLLENKSIKSSEEKSYFFIPSKDKEDAEKLGAKWDRSVKYWYVPQGIDLTPFDKRWKRIDESTIELAKNEKQERDKLRKELKVEKDNQNQKITQSNSIDSAKKKGRSR